MNDVKIKAVFTLDNGEEVEITEGMEIKYVPKIWIHGSSVDDINKDPLTARVLTIGSRKITLDLSQHHKSKVIKYGYDEISIIKPVD